MNFWFFLQLLVAVTLLSGCSSLHPRPASSDPRIAAIRKAREEYDYGPAPRNYQRTILNKIKNECVPAQWEYSLDFCKPSKRYRTPSQTALTGKVSGWAVTIIVTEKIKSSHGGYTDVLNVTRYATVLFKNDDIIEWPDSPEIFRLKPQG